MRPPSAPSPTVTHDVTASTALHVTQSATPAAPTPTDDPADAAYRDLLARVREEREQLGQLISHPF
jgi:hypothetical protein